MVFYNKQIISNKGPLGIVWVAAHLDRQLKRNQIIEASITTSVDEILNTEFPQLRLSSQLLLGVVRIYSRKVGYLYQECNDALISIRDVSQKPAAGNAATAAGIAPREAITLPNNLELDDIATNIALPSKHVPPLDLQMGASTSMAVGSDMEGMFGTHMSGSNREQFDDLDGGIPFDLAVDDFDRMREEPIDPVMPLDTQPSSQQPGADMEDLVEFNIDLNITFDESLMAEPMDVDQAADAAEAPPPLPEGAAAGAATAATGKEHAEEEQPAGKATKIPAAAGEQDRPLVEDPSQPDRQETQAEASTQQTEEPEGSTQPDTATQHTMQQSQETQHEDAQQSEHVRASRRSSRRSATAAAEGIWGDTAGASWELRSRRSRTATPSVGGSQPETFSQVEPGSSQVSAGSKAFRRAPGQYLSKRDPVVDISKAEQRVMVQLPGHLQRQLLEDRSSLLTERGKLFKKSAHGNWQADESLLKPEGGPLYRCILAAAMAAPLQQLYCISMDMVHPEELINAHSPEKKSRKRPSEEEAEQPTDTAQATSTAVPGAADAHTLGVPPPTPGQPTPAHSNDTHMDRHADDGILPTPEMSCRDDGDANNMKPMPADGMDLAPHGVEEDARSVPPTEEQQPTSSKRPRDEAVVEDEDEAAPLPSNVITDLTAGGVDDDDEAAKDSVTAKSFTRRTRVVVAALKAAVEYAGTTSTTGKRHRASASTAVTPHHKLQLSSFVKGNNRLHASRWFFELLVLKSKGVVELQQRRAYADVAINPTEKLAEVTAS